MALEDFVSIALDEEGYQEKSDGTTKYGEWYGLPSGDWCVMFVSWCANQADIMTTSSTGSVPKVPKMASTSALFRWYTNNRRDLSPSMSSNNPNRLQVGDIVIINTQNGGAVTDHVGIVVGVNYNTGEAEIMEGNRSNRVKKLHIRILKILQVILLPISAVIIQAINSKK